VLPRRKELPLRESEREAADAAGAGSIRRG
jgi:hypothetical protein